jgi:hypothetical protein
LLLSASPQQWWSQYCVGAIRGCTYHGSEIRGYTVRRGNPSRLASMSLTLPAGWYDLPWGECHDGDSAPFCNTTFRRNV